MGRGFNNGSTSNTLAPVNDPGLCKSDVAKFSRSQELDCRLKMRSAALLQTDLHNPLSPVDRLNQGGIFGQRMRCGALQIDVLTRLAREGRHRGMPVVWSRNHDSIDGGVVEQVPEVSNCRRGLLPGINDFPDRRSELAFVHIAQRPDFDTADLSQFVGNQASLISDSDDSDSKPLIRGFCRLGRCGGDA